MIFWKGAKPLLRLLLMASAGGVAVFSFAPYYLWFIAPFCISLLFITLQGLSSARQGFFAGYIWGLAFFAFGIRWLFTALHEFGNMPAPMASLSVFVCAAYLALYPAVISALYVRLKAPGIIRSSLLFACLWALGELLRGWVFTGFPWLSIGYSQSAPAPLAGFAPLVGVYGISLVVVFVSAEFVRLLRTPTRHWSSALVLSGIFLGAWLLADRQWTEPTGKTLEVSLVQPNVPQALKWSAASVAEQVLSLSRYLQSEPGRLVVLPETALPILDEQLPPFYFAEMQQQAAKAESAAVVGVFHRDSTGAIYNAARLVTGKNHDGAYFKHHLVPFGEYSPPLFGWLYRWVDLPISDQQPGAYRQPPFVVAGQQVMLNICYEDLFGAQIAKNAGAASHLLNISNLAWYGRSIAQMQHLQIAQLRAAETGRVMLRSTNTGLTAVIGTTGRVIAQLPEFHEAVLRFSASGYRGETPYMRWTDWPVWLFVLLCLCYVLVSNVTKSIVARRP